MTTRCQKIGKSVSNHFWKLLINFGDQLSMGTNCLGDHLSMGTKCLGTVCPGGPIVLGTICPWGPNFWGPIVQGDQLSWGPNEPGLFVLGDQLWGTKCLGTECVRDQMRSSRHFQDYLPTLSTYLVCELPKFSVSAYSNLS